MQFCRPGLVKYHFPVSGLALDTESDLLSLGLITPKSEAVIARVDSASSNDYLELEIVRKNSISILDCKPKSFSHWLPFSPIVKMNNIRKFLAFGSNFRLI